MTIRIKKQPTGDSLLHKVEKKADVSLSKCYQCKKCSVGCPVAGQIESPPSEIIRRLQLGAGDELLQTDLIWTCLSCDTCYARCPNEINFAAVIDALRSIALEKGAAKPEGNPPLFNRLFLDTVKTYGRAYDLQMIGLYKIKTGRLLPDTEKFPTMIKKGKIALTPPSGADKGKVRRIFERLPKEKRNREMKYAYYPGCSAHSTARDMHESSLAVAKALGIELAEIKGWTCCGASAAHQTDRALAASLAAANLVLCKEMGLDMVVNCAACYNRSKAANYEVVNSASVRDSVRQALGQPYDGSVEVRHFVEVLSKDIGPAKLRKSFKQPLNGLKVACYYGCYLVRPPEVTQFDDPENPTILENLVEEMGGESLDWPGKVDCCGGGLNLTRTEITVKRSAAIIEMAQQAGADCIAVACPMCQTSLDLRQKDIEKATGKRYNMPIVYITQLVGLCLGISAKELGFDRLMVPAGAVIKAAGAATL